MDGIDIRLCIVSSKWQDGTQTNQQKHTPFFFFFFWWLAEELIVSFEVLQSFFSAHQDEMKFDRSPPNYDVCLDRFG